MKASKARIERAVHIRDLANSIARSPAGIDEITTYGGGKFRAVSRAAKVGNLNIMTHVLPNGEHMLDVWEDRKVFSIWWDDSGHINLIAFKPGQWPLQLAMSQVQP